MRYSYEFKRKCVEMYYQGRYPNTPEAKLELVVKVITGESIKSAALNAGISDGMLYQWFRKYKDFGYNGLIDKKK